jgi:pSer/pThr/pTyr-binding forkhead associated (FHA) protein
MPESNSSENNTSGATPAVRRREFFFERLIRRVLSSFGALFDRPLGRAKSSDALPSTSDLSERLKTLIDKHVRPQSDGGRLAPHLIRLNYSWGQASDEFLASLKRLEQELLVVAVDHINDNRYRLIAPVKLEAKPNVLTEGFTLSVGFDASDANSSEKVEVSAEIFAGLLPASEMPQMPQKPLEVRVSAIAALPGGAERDAELFFVPDGKNNLIVGRAKENDLFLDDKSVSKMHASLVLDGAGKLRVADIGSTNGTYLNGERIAYGKAYEITTDDEVGFGEVKVKFDWEMPQAAEEENVPVTNGEIENGKQSGSDDAPDFKVHSHAQLEGGSESETAIGKKPEIAFTSSDEPETVMKKSPNNRTE